MLSPLPCSDCWYDCCAKSLCRDGPRRHFGQRCQRPTSLLCAPLVYRRGHAMMARRNRSGDDLKRFLPALIGGAMLLGVLVGYLINSQLSPEDAKAAASHLS